MMRQNKIAKLHIALAKARADDDGKGARARLVELCGIYEARPETARARARVLELSREIIDGRDLIDLAERTLVLPLDDSGAARNRQRVQARFGRHHDQPARVARRDFRRRPGDRADAPHRGNLRRTSGPARLLQAGALRRLASRDHRHGLAIGDSLLAAGGRPRHRGEAFRRELGEGVLNGLLTARVGLSAMAVCRPMPFVRREAARRQPTSRRSLFGDKTKS